MRKEVRLSLIIRFILLFLWLFGRDTTTFSYVRLSMYGKEGTETHKKFEATPGATNKKWRNIEFMTITTIITIISIAILNRINITVIIVITIAIITNTSPLPPLSTHHHHHHHHYQQNHWGILCFPCSVVTVWSASLEGLIIGWDPVTLTAKKTVSLFISFDLIVTYPLSFILYPVHQPLLAKPPPTREGPVDLCWSFVAFKMANA